MKGDSRGGGLQQVSSFGKNKVWHGPACCVSRRSGGPSLSEVKLKALSQNVNCV